MKVGFKVILVLGIIAILVAVPRFFFYQEAHIAGPVGLPNYENIAIPPTTLPSEFTDVYQKRAGVVVVDLTHENNFTLNELNLFLFRIISRGYTIEYLQKAEPRKSVLQKKLRLADGLVVILPSASYSEDEVKLVREFVDKGGKLLLIADPTRPGKINSLSGEFGLAFESSYLYNLKERESNFRNVFISTFETNQLTRKLTKIALYTAGYISPASNGIAFTDDNTFSSLTDAKGRFSPVALSAGAKVLALADFSFMSEPLNAVYDNNQFISNIADWLTASGRVFTLSDFPYSISDNLSIAYLDAATLDTATRLKATLTDMGKEVQISQQKAPLTFSKDTIFLGLFKEAEAVKSYLDKANISITVEKELITIEVSNIGKVYKAFTSLIYLHEENGKRLLLILADTEDMLKETVDLMPEGKFRQWLVTEQLAVYRKLKPAEVKPAAK